MIKRCCYLATAVVLALGGLAEGQESSEVNDLAKGKKKEIPPFTWVSPATQWKLKRCPDELQHGTFQSPSMKESVGYYIYLPPGYDLDEEVCYPVVYHLHGGRPGSEQKSIELSTFVDAAIRAGKIPPTIYVFPNGGPMSWYDYPKKELGMGESIFVEELIPHIDETYRTWGTSSGRALEGFSQGGRGTTRIGFGHPELWSSIAPGGSGYEPEKRIQENEGWESDSIQFLPLGYNAWDLASEYAARKNSAETAPLPVLLWVGTKGFNYEYNLKFSAFLEELNVAHELHEEPDVGHSAKEIYDQSGERIMLFHQKHFRPESED
ncbi:MAG: alpha/beta hydrolase-fold protein [Verrucomicrobiota bacterium]